MVLKLIRRFYRGEHGQDVAEYCLITAAVALVALGIFVVSSGGVKSVWNSARGTLAETPAPAAGPASPATASSPASN